MAFQYKGSLASSKSLMNRALIVKSHFPELNIYGQSPCDDVRGMQEALQLFKHGASEFDCGAAGTVLRFLALRLARESGEYFLTGTEQLLKRLPEDLVQVLSQLGAEVKTSDRGLKIKSYGWKVMGDALHLQAKLSSQFATAVFINAWNYPLDLFITVPKSMASMSYFKMTLKFLKQLGMQIESRGQEYRIPKNQKVTSGTYVCESDMGSNFALAAAAVLAGNIELEQFVQESVQPDIYFLEVLKKMQIEFKLSGSSLLVQQQSQFSSLSVDLNNNPDLLPVLAVLCSFAEGKSKLYGAPHLTNKESNRIETTFNLLQKAGVDCKKLEDGVLIQGQPNLPVRSFNYHCQNDHRLAMAAGLLMLKKFDIQLTKKADVNKSFPEFWNIIGLAGG